MDHTDIDKLLLYLSILHIHLLETYCQEK